MRIIKCARGNSIDDMITAIEDRIDQLSNIKRQNATYSATSDTSDVDEVHQYIDNLMQIVDQQLAQDIPDSSQYSITDTAIVITIPYFDKVLQFEVPISDLTLTESAFDDNVDYIVEEIKGSL